ncbi:MAG: tRNA pseudouridine(55) synthase TruB [Salinibacterium sp.]|nr:MAG: tRNA pseudouridine(55) synthase TruB [Salinibacterium sp.]
MSAAPRDARSGILLVDKPQGITSHDVVACARRIIGTRKIGHAGTLDPMATGLLVLGVNSSTRLLTWVVGLDKEYLATIRLGAASTTDDAEGELLERSDVSAVTDELVAAGIRNLTGAISQRPSAVSAIKVDGKRAYALVREGVEVELASRSVTVSAFEVLGVERGEWLDVRVRVECSSGTYIRALARDLGEALGVGGHLRALRRTRIGPFTVAEASALDDSLPSRLLAPAAVAKQLFDHIDLSAEQAVDLANGKRIALPASASGKPIATIGPHGRLIGLVENIDGRAKVLVNFPTDALGNGAGE